MSEQIEEVEDLEQPTADGELVHWMARPPLRVGPAGVSVTAGLAFSLGVAAAVSALALMGWLRPPRAMAFHRRGARL